jgi:hypothetical protein
MTPKRIQRKRVKGWKMPAGCVCVTRPGMFGNPFVVGVHGTAEECKAKFRLLLVLTGGELLDFLWRWAVDEVWVTRLRQNYSTLRGQDVACWCPLDQPCHADVLLELANR